MSDRKILSVHQAKLALRKGRTVHTFRSAGFALIGCDWKKKDVIEHIKEYGVELAGPNMLRMDHGLATPDKNGDYIFLETKPEWKELHDE